MRNGKWHVQVRLKGHAPVSETLPEGTKKHEAREWGLEKERRLKLGDIPTEQFKVLRGVTVKQLIVRFQEDREANPHKRNGAMPTRPLRSPHS
jgi:hypothetical protein